MQVSGADQRRQFFEWSFDYDAASDAQKQAAADLCVEEMNGLPSCKAELIAESACLYALENKKFDLTAYDKALKACKDKCANDAECAGKCETDDEAVVKANPCGASKIASDKCWSDLQEDDARYQAIQGYISDYAGKYEKL